MNYINDNIIYYERGDIMKFFQLVTTILLKENIHFSKSSEVIGNTISKAMINDEKLKELHKCKEYKYVFDNLYPLEKDGIYKGKRIYIFNIRSFNEDYVIKIKHCFNGLENNYMEIISTDLRTIKRKPINYIETITPAVVTVDSKPWLSDGDILLLVKRLHANAEKKFKFFFHEEIEEVEDYFIEKLKILNKKPIAYSYKNIKLLANKVRIKVNEDDISQKLAFTVLGGGLAEKNSIIGAGFCKCDWR